mmetsp:Transcript_25275/g.72784  ORF Transcript_25275/g.72784 Transcript_25275/m.72784 type:complete len:93 (+) Transcript_25275:249-527(+)
MRRLVIVISDSKDSKLVEDIQAFRIPKEIFRLQPPQHPKSVLPRDHGASCRKRNPWVSVTLQIAVTLHPLLEKRSGEPEVASAPHVQLVKLW